jgi:phosphoglycerate dehydrogenase-like enzyme
MLPGKDDLTVCFGHVAYQFEPAFAARQTGVRAFQCWTREDLRARIAEADVLVVSGYWDNALIPLASKLKFIQSVSAGTDQYDRAALSEAGIRLASAAGVNARAVSEHAIAMILAIARRLPEARDNQHKRVWRGMIGDPAGREDELGGKTIAIVGPGRIGGRLAQLARAFDMHVIALKRDPSSGVDGAAEVLDIKALHSVLPRADYVVLTCPLTPETTGLIGAAELGLMKRDAYLINCARGRVVDEAALISALQQGGIAGAGIDVTVEEPLGADSPLWGMANVLLTPHSAGETRRYEDNVLDLLVENVGRLWRGESALVNGVV